jgi:SAM-dependent methyltransferase
MSVQGLDSAKIEAFAGKMLGIVNGAFVGLMTSIGHQTGLFDTMAGLPASTSDKIAGAAGLNERYVREWLGSMVTAQIVEYDPAARTYRLPPEHAVCITRAAGPDNLASFTQYVALAAGVEKDIVRCFREGGGVPYAKFPDFQRMMFEESRLIYDATLLQRTLPALPRMVARLEAGIDVADFGCGQGHAVNLMAARYPKSRFEGYDFSTEGIAAARAEAAEMRLANAGFEVRDLAAIDFSAKYDLITAFDSIHDQAKPRQVLANIARALRPGGTFLMVDIAASSALEGNLQHPLGPGLYAMSTMHCMTVSLAYGGEGLGNMWGEQKARELLSEAGFKKVEVFRVPGDIINNYYVATRG